MAQEQIDWTKQLKHHLVLLSHTTDVIEKIKPHAAEQDHPKMDHLLNESGLLTQMLQAMNDEAPHYAANGDFKTNSLISSNTVLSDEEYQELLDYTMTLFQSVDTLHAQVEANLTPLLAELPTEAE